MPKWISVLRYAGVGIAAILSVALFFRAGVLTGFSVVFGDTYDGLIEASILEHWFNVFRGVSGWQQTLSFHPVPATLGYNDSYLMFGAGYSVFRSLGADPLLASECVNIAVKLVGFAGFYAFAVRALGLPSWCAALGAAVFTVSNNSYMRGGHAQLFTVAFAPVLAVFLWSLVAAVERRDRRAVASWGVASAVLFPAWLLTGYYMAWFFTAFCLVWVPLLALAAGRQRLLTFAADTRACWLPLAGSAVLLALGIVLFISLYLPKAAETGMHGAEEMSGFLLSPLDLVYLGEGNLLHGGWQAWLRPALSPNMEHATGLTPLVLIAFVAGSVWAVRQGGAARTAGCMALAAGALWLAATSFGGNSLWSAVYAYVPGAKAVRVVSRIQILLAWPVVSVAAVGLAAAAATLRRTTPNPAMLVGTAGLLLVVEQVNLQPVPALDRTLQKAWLESVPSPPAECRSFFVTEPRPPDPRFGPVIGSMVGHNIDAMLLAEWWGLPTPNGFASLLPPGWNLLWIGNPDYSTRVREYAARTGIEAGLCGVSLLTGTWQTKPFAG